MFNPLKRFRRKREIPEAPTMRIPTDRVMDLSHQGLSEPEIIRNLRGEGYSPLEIDHAMKEALRVSVAPAPRAPPAPEEEFAPPAPPEREKGRELPRRAEPLEIEKPPLEEPRPALEELELPERKPLPSFPEPFEAPEAREEFEPEPPLPEMPRPPELPFRAELPLREKLLPPRELEKKGKRETEELIEEVVEEKWRAVGGEMETIKDKFKELGDKIKTLEEASGKIGVEKKDEIEEIKKKIDDYKELIDDVNAKIDSLESVVKNSLTPLMEALRSFSETVKILKGKKK